MIAMDVVPVPLREKSQFLRPMKISLTACSALLLDKFKATIFYNVHELVHVLYAILEGCSQLAGRQYGD